MRKLIFAIFLVLAALLALQCWRSDSPGDLPGSSQKRLISLAPNLTTLTFGLGLGSQLIGVTTYCDDPPEALSLQRVGNFLSPNLEKILALRPDLILAEKWVSSRTVPRLRRLGLEVLELPAPQSILEIRRLILRLGGALQNPRRAAGLIQEMDQHLASIREKAGTLRWRPKVYIEIDIPAWTVGSVSFTNEALEIAGFQNVFGDLHQPAPRVSSEAIIERNPDIIISFAATADQIANRPGWQEITALRRKWIIDDFPEAWLSRGNHRLMEGTLRFQERVEMLPGWNPAAR